VIAAEFDRKLLGQNETPWKIPDLLPIQLSLKGIVSPAVTYTAVLPSTG
jgi:hypothetical protein